MPLQDEMTFQRIEVLLDMQAKKLTAELHKLREELSQAKEELRKEIHAVRQDTSSQQFGPTHVQMYAEAPQQQPQQPMPRYAQEQQAPRYAQDGQQYPQYPQQNFAQPVSPYPQGRTGDKPPETRPIDRNGVAPSDVSVEKFFYSGSKKK